MSLLFVVSVACPCCLLKGKGKDVDLYSTFHAPGTANAHVTKTGPSDRYLGHRQACKHSPGSDPITGTCSASQLVLGFHLRNPSLMDYYSFNRPRRDGWLSWPCWLTDSGRFTHKVVTRPAISLAQDRESSPARTGVLTTMLRNLSYCLSCY